MSFLQQLGTHRLAISTSLAVGLLTACGGDDGGLPLADGGTREGIHPRFDLAPDPMEFGAIPFPDDLYLGAEGRIAIGTLPGQEANEPYHASLRQTLQELDGFGVVSSIFFTFDGELDADSLPEVPAASTRDDASVFLVDVDLASPDALRRIPILADWEPVLRQLALRPMDGWPLREGGRYAAVVTTHARGADGIPVSPDPDFAAIRDAAARPEDPLLGEAYDSYAPVLATLETNGVPRSEVAALAVFRVQTITSDLLDARAIVRARSSPTPVVLETIAAGERLDAALGTPMMDVPGLDVPGGVQHGNVGWMIHGTFTSPWLISESPRVHGRFTRDAMGMLEIKSSDVVPFTLWVPRVIDPAGVRVVLYQHGLSSDRSAALSVVDALNGVGYAVLAIDAPFHGMRLQGGDGVDTRNRFTGEERPDRFGDVTGANVVIEFAGILDSAGALEGFHPVYLRDALRQAVVDLYAAAHLIADGDLAAIRGTDPGLAELAFADAPIGFVGYSLGGIIGTMFVATEDDVGAGVLGVTGGHVTLLVTESPPFNMGYFPLLLPLLGLEAETIDYQNLHPTFIPQVAIWQTLLDRGDSIAYAPVLRGQAKDVLFLMARDDETLNNVGTEALARAAGAVILGGVARHADIAAGTAPVRGNLETGGEMATRVLQVWDPASHGLLTVRNDVSRWAHPVQAPFMSIDERAVPQPIDAAIAQLIHFFESWRSGDAEVASPALL